MNKDYMKQYTPIGVVVDVVAMVIATNKLVAVAEENVFFLFHIIFKNTTF
ncbi:hypothetical protein QWY90_06470 [Flavobacterium paronense]|uniref:Uncharacterized protein n=1 Tax=Flavobacterium paronense TaxID=1392775 RepID=A0ABV5GG05_9FLAO|nr:hypothetical protein [Flavobacterium paronense]MDN3676951.1 hypothetical protein [Flavobacterium paronense]